MSSSSNNKENIASRVASTVQKLYTKRGYAIYKKYYSSKTLNNTKKDLMMAPFTMNDFNNKPPSFPIYLESPQKLYLPKHYGFEKFGTPDNIKIDRGEPIELKFNGSLKEIQIEIINKFLDSCILNDNFNPSELLTKTNGGIVSVFCGAGKCHLRDTPILMYDGSIKMVQDVIVGDQVMGDDSTPRNVLQLERGREIMYRVVPTKGDPYVVNKSHILSLKVSTHINNSRPKGSIVDISVEDYLKLPKSYHGKGGPLLGYRVGVTFPNKDIGFDPYILGYWLGDGSSKGSGFSSQDASVLYGIRDILKNKYDNLFISYVSQYDYRITSIKKGSRCNEFLNFLKDNNLIDNKHIPNNYKCNSRDIQLQVLAGIIDSDGSYSKGGFDIIQKNEKLLDDIIYIARSLGFAAYKLKCEKSCMYKGERKTGTYYRTNIHGKGLEEIPVKIPRKKASSRKQIKDVLSTRIRLEELPEDDYYGFELDGNRRYLLGDFTVTHNTVMGLNIIAQLSRKAIVVVHKEFLMNQWKERIKQFLPGARVGTIQGNNGSIKIGNLYNLWNNNKELPLIKSYNLNNKCFEWKRITYSWEKENNELIEIHTSNMIFKSTHNHKYLTSNGWCDANKLNIGDLLVSNKDDLYTLLPIENILYNTHYYNKVYDIEIEDNHNFVISNNSSFGVVVHNCHHISAEVFSRSLPKINSFYSLGLSATPNRTDGLSKVFYMYLGPMIYKSDKRPDKKIRVNAIRYMDRNEDYSREETSVIGKACLPKMITNIVNHNARNHMIETLVYKLVHSNEAEPRKILLLSDRRDHLEDFYKRCSKFASVGFYVGGMKQKDLDISEKQQVILGTYPMSSEGLDIGDLNTVIFTTPKSNIEQSIGRIVRKQHAIEPLAFDIIDDFSVFPNQYKKRLQIYKKLEYDIYELRIKVKDYLPTSNPFDMLLDEPYTKVETGRKKKNNKPDSDSDNSDNENETNVSNRLMNECLIDE
jgi:superfamily II DNA or RNA helicase